MDFQLAADYLHNTFTLGEKQLAKDFSESFYLDELPRIVSFLIIQCSSEPFS